MVLGKRTAGSMAHEQSKRGALRHRGRWRRTLRNRRSGFRCASAVALLVLSCAILVPAASAAAAEADAANEIATSAGEVNNRVASVASPNATAEPPAEERLPDELEPDELAPEELSPEELTPEMSLSLAELLASPDEELQPEGERCLRGLNQTQVTILDDSHLLFRGRGRRFWLNRLRGRCHGMRPDMILVTERQGTSRQCEFDTIYATPRNRLGGAGIESGRCYLGKFEPVTADHAGVLKVAFEQQRRDLRKRQRAERRQRRAAKRAQRQKIPSPQHAEESDTTASAAPVEPTHD